MRKLTDESKWRIKQFLNDCLHHVRKVSKKPVSSEYLVRKYGDFMRMNEWTDVAATGFWWRFLKWSITTEDVLSSLNKLEKM